MAEDRFPRRRNRKDVMFYVFLVFLIVLLGANIYIRVAIYRVNLFEEGKSSLGIHAHTQYTLPEGTYTVLGKFAGEYGSTSHITFSAIERKYFSVLVTDAHGEQFVMAARVQGRELSALEEGRTVELKGLGSELAPEKEALMRESLADMAADISGYCIYDNGEGGF